MRAELVDMVCNMLAVENDERQDRHDFTLVKSEYATVNPYFLTLSIMKIGDGEFSFGHSVANRMIERTVECGKCVFRGQFRRLLTGYLKALHKNKQVCSHTNIERVLEEVIVCLTRMADPVCVDESKVDIGKWEMPKINRKFFSI